MEELKWISVNDALPPIGKTVVTRDRINIGIGSIKNYVNKTPSDCDYGIVEDQYAIWTSSNKVHSPTHWLILPKLED